MVGDDGGVQRQIGGVVDTEVRNPRVQRRTMAVIPATGLANEGWKESKSGARSGRVELIETTLGDFPDIVVAQWLRLDEFSHDPVAEPLGWLMFMMPGYFGGATPHRGMPPRCGLLVIPSVSTLCETVRVDDLLS